MVRLEATAAPNISDPKLEGLPGELVNVKPGADPGLQGERKLREVDESLLASVRCAVAQWLHEQEGRQTGSLQASLHPPDTLQRDGRVKVAVDADNAGAGLGHPDSRVLHLHVEEWSEELLASALLCHKEQALGRYFACSLLVLYGIRELTEQ